MQCKDVQNKFIPFINDELNQKELKEFLGHIHQCKNCYEEYDIYYTMIMGMRYLESDNNKTELKIDSGQKIREVEDYLLQYKILQCEKIILLVVLCIGWYFYYNLEVKNEWKNSINRRSQYIKQGILRTA